MDWPRVAYAAARRATARRSASGTWSPAATSAVKSGQHGFATHHAAEIAIAGKRLAWIRSQQLGNTELDHWLYTAPLGGPARLLKQHARLHRHRLRAGRPPDGRPGRLGNVYGRQHLGRTLDGSVSSNQRLDLITPKGCGRSQRDRTRSSPSRQTAATSPFFHVPPPSLAPGLLRRDSLLRPRRRLLDETARCPRRFLSPLPTRAPWAIRSRSAATSSSC